MSDTIIVYENGKAIGGEGHPTNADEITFNNEDTDLVSEEVESAIKEVNAKLVGKADKTDIATVESGTTASRAYSVGELVYVSGTLYRVKTAIASGATFTVGTNIEVTDVSSEVKSFRNNSFGSTVNLSLNVDYTAPCDGYVVAGLNGSDTGGVGVMVNNIALIYIDAGKFLTQSVFVRKGSVIKAYTLSNASARFIPLT